MLTFSHYTLFNSHMKRRFKRSWGKLSQRRKAFGRGNITSCSRPQTRMRMGQGQGALVSEGGAMRSMNWGPVNKISNNDGCYLQFGEKSEKRDSEKTTFRWLRLWRDKLVKVSVSCSVSHFIIPIWLEPSMYFQRCLHAFLFILTLCKDGPQRAQLYHNCN